MDISKVLEQLRKELEHLDAAIVSLERLQQRERRRGRPPKALAALDRPRSEMRPSTDQRAEPRKQRRNSPPD